MAEDLGAFDTGLEQDIVYKPYERPVPEVDVYARTDPKLLIQTDDTGYNVVHPYTKEDTLERMGSGEHSTRIIGEKPRDKKHITDRMTQGRVSHSDDGTDFRGRKGGSSGLNL